VGTDNSRPENGTHSCRLVILGGGKNLKKVTKKSLSSLLVSNKPGIARTRRPNPPFKKSLKKVKKKLVSALEI
jgi:histidinol phosphatase-like enzyme